MRPLYLLCLATRAAIAYGSTIARTWGRWDRTVLTAVLAAVAIAFGALYAFGLRKTGAEVVNGVIWWDHLRPLHSLLYGAAAYFMFYGSKQVYVPLSVDVAVGLLAYLWKYSS